MLAILATLTASSYAYTLPIVSAPRACHRAALPAARAASGLQMNLGERFVRLVKSNVNQAISSMEDPEKVLEQAVADMQKDLVKVRQAYAEVSASSKRMTEQAKLAESEAAKWCGLLQCTNDRFPRV
eukprot:2626303-Prymnesium_polylepis.1